MSQLVRFCSGNILITGSTTSVVIGLTWGGMQYSWTSASVLAPLVLGLVGLVSFVIYELRFCKSPTVSLLAYMRTSLQYFSLKVPILFDLNWTGTSGYLQNFVMAVVLASLSCTSSNTVTHRSGHLHSLNRRLVCGLL